MRLNFFFLLLFFFLVPFFLKTKEEPSISFEQFKQDLSTYCPAPGWIVKSFLSMDLETCNKAWQEVVELLTVKTDDYFSSSSTLFHTMSAEKKIDLIFNECTGYLFFLQSILVHHQTKKLIYLNGPLQKEQWQQMGFSSLFEYWRKQSNQAYFDSIAFFFDVVIKKLVYAIQNAYMNMDSFLWHVFERESQYWYAYLQYLFQSLRSSHYENDYAQRLRQYRNILLCLGREKRDYDAQWE